MLDNHKSKSKIVRGSQDSQLERELWEEEDEQVLWTSIIEGQHQALSGIGLSI